jgi:hypothetical protein
MVIAMDDDLRQEIADLFRLDDEMRRDHEKWERQRAKQRSSDIGLRYRVQENALIEKNAGEPTADAVSRDDVLAMLDDLAGMLGEEVAIAIKSAIAPLEAEIADLRNQIAVLQSQKSSVTPISRAKNVA